MGADHTAGYAVTANILKVGGYVDPLKPEGTDRALAESTDSDGRGDSTGMCLFIAFAVLDQPDTFQALIDMINAFYGLNLTGEDVGELGKKVLKMEREFTQELASLRPGQASRYFSRDPCPAQCGIPGQRRRLDKVFNCNTGH